jgi:hypothetical protein
MSLSPEVSLPTSVATGALVWAIYASALPNITDIRVGGQNDDHIASTERMATWTSLATVSAISLIARDPNVFIVGGAMTVALAWWHRHANAVDPDTGKASTVSAVRTPDMYMDGPAS